SAVSPFNVHEFLIGLETLHLRLERHSENALKVAQFLEEHPKVSWANYSGLKSNAYHNLAKKYLPNGQGAILTFGVCCSFEDYVKLEASLKLYSQLAILNDSKSLIMHPSSTSNLQLSQREKKSSGD